MEVLTLALLVAVGLHVIVITQLHFNLIGAGESDQAPSLDVILVDSASETPPEEADFLAQASQTGGGDNTELERPSAPPVVEPGAPQPVDPPRPEESTDPAPEAPPDAAVVSVPTPDAVPEQTVEDASEPREVPDARALIEQSRELAQSAPDPLDFERVLPKRPRRKFITANTREHLYAAYMRAWVAKVERVGNMNYPDQARRQGLDGSLVLSVDVLPDGSIERVQVLRSSGHDLLDEAAVRIVRLSAPYAELPPEIRAQTDILTITRTWQFSARQGLN